MTFFVLFALLKNGKDKAVDEICTNLKTLIKQLRKGDCVSYEKINNLDIILPKFKLDSEKERLKALVSAEKCKNIKCLLGPSKKKKQLVDLLCESVPTVTTIDELIGKPVEHYIYDYNRVVNWCPGIVAVSKSDSELIIRYDTEDTLHSFNFIEFYDALDAIVIYVFL